MRVGWGDLGGRRWGARMWDGTVGAVLENGVRYCSYEERRLGLTDVHAMTASRLVLGMDLKSRDELCFRVGGWRGGTDVRVTSFWDAVREMALLLGWVFAFTSPPVDRLFACMYNPVLVTGTVFGVSRSFASAFVAADRNGALR